MMSSRQNRLPPLQPGSQVSWITRGLILPCGDTEDVTFAFAWDKKPFCLHYDISNDSFHNAEQQWRLARMVVMTCHSPSPQMIEGSSHQLIINNRWLFVPMANEAFQVTEFIEAPLTASTPSWSSINSWVSVLCVLSRTE